MASLKDAIIRSPLFAKLIDPFANAYDGLPEERKTQLQCGFIALIVIFFGLIIFQGYRTIGKMQDELIADRKNGAEFVKKLGRFQQQQGRVELLKSKLEQVKPDFSLISFIERNAIKANIPKEAIDRIDSKDQPGGELAKRVDAEVSLLNITIRQLVDFLYYMESSQYPLIAKNVKIVKRFDNANFLDASVTIAFASPKAEGALPQ